MARWAAFINRHGKSDANRLMVDAGNYVDRAGNDSGCSSKCQFMVTSYLGLGYDILNFGKQEAWMGYTTLKTLLDTTKSTRFISANLLDRKANKPMAEPFVIQKYKTMRIGVLGLLSESDFPRGTAMLDTINLVVRPFMDAAKEYLPELARKADAVVVLADLTSDKIDTLVKTFPEIDLIISAGALRTGETMSTVGRTRLLGTGSSGYNGHYVIMEFNPSWGDSIAYAPFMDPLTDGYEEKSVWSEKLAAFEATQPAPAATSSPFSVTPMPAGQH